MAYTDPAYVIFDGDNDKWAYSFMRGWNASEKVDFNFADAHDLDNMTSRAQGEAYVKAKLRERMARASAVIVLIGESTKNLYKFVRWEIELAMSLGRPIIAVNLNEKRAQDDNLVPPIIRNECVVHVAFKMKIIKFALENWPNEYRHLVSSGTCDGPRHYSDQVYSDLGLRTF